MNSKTQVCLGTVLVTGLLVGASSQAQAQPAKPPQDVAIKQVGGTTVTSTLPISGNVGITGTVPVSVAGTVPVSGSVAVTGTVPVTGNVAITGTVPVSGNVGTQDRDNKARNYYYAYLNCGYAVGICSTDGPVVPAGKRLIIEHVSGEADMSGASDLWRVSLWIKDQSPSAFFEIGTPRVTMNYLYAHVFNAGIFAAFDAGQTPQLVLQSSGAGGFAWTAVLTGYLVDIP
jgi:hypothetical protein